MLNKRVLINNKSRMDHAFQGRTGTAIELTSHGYMRIHLDGDQETQRVLVHPESVEFTGDMLHPVFNSILSQWIEKEIA
jgi:ribosomal protein L21E